MNNTNRLYAIFRKCNFSIGIFSLLFSLLLIYAISLTWKASSMQYQFPFHIQQGNVDYKETPIAHKRYNLGNKTKSSIHRGSECDNRLNSDSGKMLKIDDPVNTTPLASYSGGDKITTKTTAKSKNRLDKYLEDRKTKILLYCGDVCNTCRGNEESKSFDYS